MRKLLILTLCILFLGVTAQAGIVDKLKSVIARKNAGGAGGPDAWYYTSQSTSGSYWPRNDYTRWANVTIAESGTATLLRVRLKVDCDSPQTFRVCLYDSAEDLIVGGTAASPGASGSDVDLEIDIADTAVSAGTHYISVTTARAPAGCAELYTDGGTGDTEASSTYSADCCDPADTGGYAAPADYLSVYVD